MRYKGKRQLGRAIGILLAATRLEGALHEDVDAYHAPSECHGPVSRGQGKRLRYARRRALHAAGFNSLRLIRRAARQAMGHDAPIYRRFGEVPY